MSETRGEKAVRLLRETAEAIRELPVPYTILGQGWNAKLLEERADWIEATMRRQTIFLENSNE